MRKAVLIGLMLVAGYPGFAVSFAGFTGGQGDGDAHGDFLTLPETPVAAHFLGGNRDGYGSAGWKTRPPANDPARARFAGNGRDGYASARFISTWPQTPGKAYSGGSFDGYVRAKWFSLWQQTRPRRFLGGSFDGYDRRALLGLPNWTLGDTDGNALPDWWELKYFGVLTGTRPNGDADHDGASNLFEYLTGTNPTNADSYFHIARLLPGAPNKIFAYCAPGYFYTLQQADNLALGWTVVSNQTRISPASEGILELDDSSGGDHGFYRILLEH